MHRILIEPIIRAALLEDLGRAGDITTDAIVGEDTQAEALMVTRQDGVLSGMEAGLMAFELLDPSVQIERVCRDGDRIERGQTVARINGRARAIGRRAHRAQLHLPYVRCRQRDPVTG